MSAHSPTDEEVEAVFRYAAGLMRDGASAGKIEQALMAKGLEEASAAAVVTNLARQRSEALRQAGRKNMTYGALWCAGGVIVTIGGYAAASGGGGGGGGAMYVVTWGAIVFGAVQFFRGLSQSAG